jgi:hypothetical protein
MVAKKKKTFKKNMAILTCGTLVSLFLPASASPSDETDLNSTTSASWLARQLFYATLSIESLMDDLTQAELDQIYQSILRSVEGNSKSKKKPGTGGD